MSDPYIMMPGARLYLENGVPEESLGSCSCTPSLDGFNEVYEQVRPALSLAGIATGYYHGYKRNKSIGWAIVWGSLGALFPLPTGAVMLAQGFGKPKKK